MKKSALHLAITCVVWITLLSHGETAMDEGKDFLLVFPEMRNLTGTEIAIYAYKRDTNAINGLNVVSGQTDSINLFTEHSKLVINTTNIVKGSEVSDKCARYTLNGFLKLYVEMPSVGDTYLAIPISDADRVFYAVTYCEIPDSPCQIQIVARENNTRVTIIPTNIVKVNLKSRGINAGKLIVVTLWSLDVLQIQSNSDLTGTYIESDKGISVFSGSAGTSVQGSSTSTIIEQMPPVTQWGMEHVAVPTPNRESLGDYFRVVASAKNTRVRITGESSFVIPEKGGWIQRNVSGSFPKLIRSDKPVLVVRFTISESLPTFLGGPAMVVIVPTEQFVSGVELAMPKSGTDENVVTVVTKTKYKPTIRANSVAVMTGWKQVGNSAFCLNHVSLVNGENTISSTDPSAEFVAYVYGRTASNSRAFVGGRAYRELNPKCVPTTMEIGDNTDNDCDGAADEDSCTPTDFLDTDCAQIISEIPDVFGTKFLVVIPPINGSETSKHFSVHLSSTHTGIININVTTPLLSTAANDLTLTMDPSNVFEISINTDLEIFNSGLSNKTLLISTDKSVTGFVVMTSKPHESSYGGYRLIPADVLGKHYFVVTECKRSTCQMVITAAYSQTVARVLLRLETSTATVEYGGVNYTDGDTIRIDLVRYQSVMLTCVMNMTGTEVEANKPVAVFSGALHPFVGYYVSYDNIVEQLLPVYALGTKYVVVKNPFAATDDRVQILATEDNTDVSVYNNNKHQIINIKFTGSAITVLIGKDIYITSDKPVMVVYFLAGCPLQCDPAMLVVPPVSQYLSYEKLSTSLPGEVYMVLWAENASHGSVKNNDDYLTEWTDLESSPDRTTSVPRLSTGLQNLATVNGTIAGFLYVQTNSSPAALALPLAFSLHDLYQVCIISTMEIADNIDNDCDGLVDEESCTDTTPQDNDLDGMFDEDCLNSKSISSVLLSSVITSSSIVEVSSDVTDIASSSPVATSSDVIIQPASTFSEPSSSAALSSDAIIQPTSTFRDSSSSAALETFSTIAVESTSVPFDLATTQASPSLEPSTTEACLCLCRGLISNFNAESLAEAVESIQRELYVDKATVSQTVRKYISIPDSRPSASGIGYIGIGLISGLFMSIVILDAGTLIRDFAQLVRTLKEALSKKAEYDIKEK